MTARPRRTLTVALAALAVAAVALTVAVSRADRGREPEPARGAPAVHLSRVHTAGARPAVTGQLTLLAVGSDDGAPSFGRRGPAGRGRGDSLHLVVIDPAARQGAVIGIPRDAYVAIPGHGTGKINAALSLGGPELLVRTVEELSGIGVDYYALTDFDRLVALVNGVGGVPVEVTRRIRDPASGADLRPGAQRLNGRQALAYARARKTVPGGDFARSFHQGQVLLGGLAAYQGHVRTDPAALMRWLALVRAAVTTDVPTPELVGLALLARDVPRAGLRNLVLPGVAGTAGGQSVVRLTPAARAILASARDGRFTELDDPAL